MTNRVWLGGGNNKADNPKLWDPTGVPQPTDNMYMPQGTINFMGGDYSQMGLVLLGNDTVNLSHGTKVVATVPAGGGPATINIKGDDNLSLQVGSPGGNAASPVNGTVNLAANSHWIGSFNVVSGVNATNGASLLVNPGNKADFNDTGLSFVQGATARAVINADISGTTIVRVTDGGTLEVGRSVGSGQTVLLSGPSILQVDKPDQFLGSVNLIGASGAIDLEGLAKADSYTFQNDMLSIFAGKKVIDTLRLTDSTPNGFVVQQTSGSVNVVAISDPSNPPVGLPIHMG